MPMPAKPNRYSENSTLTILNPERIPQAQENFAKELALLIENRANKILQEALRAQGDAETVE